MQLAHRQPKSVLLIDDDAAERALFRERLRNVESDAFDFREAETLSDSLGLLQSEPVDLAILDLNLPDTEGLATLQSLYAAAPSVPIIVLTGLDDADLGLKAIQVGAQDFLVKGDLSPELVRRSVRYALERHKILMRLEAAEYEALQARERGSLERLAAPPLASTSARAFQVTRLQDGAPLQFSDIVADYSELLETAVNQTVTQADLKVPTRLKQLAVRLARLKVAPRDVVDIHLSALKARTTQATNRKAKAMSVEGRIVLLELMGYLAGEYRVFALGRGQGPTADPVERGSGHE